MRHTVGIQQPRKIARLGVGALGERELRQLALDDLVVDQPLHRAPLAARVVEGKPRAPQRRVLAQGILETPERTATDHRALEPVARPRVAHVADEVLHIAVAAAPRGLAQSHRSRHARCRRAPMRTAARPGR
jgi:hypothetical protein